MNALVTLDSILEPSQALTPAALFGTGQIETIVSAIETQVRAEAYDIATPEGRERIKSVAYKIARSKTTLDEIGKEHVADIKAQSAAIDKERKTLRDRLDALKDEVRKPVTEWEAAEADRIALHESALVFLAEAARFASPPSAATIRERIKSVEVTEGRDWQEFAERGAAGTSEARAALETMLAAAEQAERDAAELAELRRLKAEREEQDRANAAIEAAEVAAQQRAEAERLRAEQAKRDQEAAVARAIEQERQRAEQARIEAEQRAERDKAAAIEAERLRQEREAAAAAAKKAAEEAAEQKRQANKRNRERVHARIKGALLLEMGDAEADRLIRAIASGEIPHVSITY